MENNLIKSAAPSLSSSAASTPRNTRVVNSINLINPDELQQSHPISSDDDSTNDYGTEVHSVTSISDCAADYLFNGLVTPEEFSATEIGTPFLRGIQSRTALEHDEESIYNEIQHASITEEPVAPIENNSVFTWAFFNCPATLNIAAILLLSSGIIALSLGLTIASTPLTAVGAVVAGVGALLGVFGQFSGFVGQSAPEESVPHLVSSCT